MDPIDAAIESAESLIASLLERERAALLGDNGVAMPNGSCRPKGEEEMLDSGSRFSPHDPEASLFSPLISQSLVTEGSASQWPTTLTASSQAVLPEYFDLISPKESLHALVHKVSERSRLESLDYDSLEKLLHEREKDLEVAAKIGQLLLHRNESLEMDLSKCTEQRMSLEQQLRQIQHTVSRKEELLRLYASEQEEQPSSLREENIPNQDWVHVLTEECRELRESNLQLQEEADRLRRETADVELKEKELVQQCLEQFTEAKRRLGELREESEQKQEENQNLQVELVLGGEKLLQFEEKCQHQGEEIEVMKEQLSLAQDQNNQFTQMVAELQDKLDETSVLLKECKDENAALKDQAIQLSSSSSLSDSTQVEHESIVREIEEVLRNEIIAASTLPERPRSPNHYARQRTMVVMETVRAATLASQRKKERYTAEVAKTLPLAASSPSEKGRKPGLVCPPSPIVSDTSGNLPEELVRYRNQTYVAPEKLQIVKPLEGSVTLLKWKLLASPQLGGATSYFSDAAQPGVHRKKWKAGGVVDVDSSRLSGTRLKSLSTADISSINHNLSYPLFAHGGTETPVHSISMDMPLLPHTSQKLHTKSASPTTADHKSSPAHPADESTASRSVLSQVSSLLGSQLGFATSKNHSIPSSKQETNTHAGLSSLLDS